ncbi:hypothetical protein FC72_GL000371 [Companilactobacillus tucceti DSM 20183]|uniref:S-layer protein C-terminal domain-containing protein n=1 Tax=Companilactobacillus tucceti DSM 20183 TaxID=1423811 RepID=A0A0R1IZQ4_9LACO|nr:SLAP domain-containing protein [Companilactobacillus tucceti]KRK64488.1 hypothetical protein FC72_GL000371 [Companilactobacillus tucceti DSM 20183]
MKKTKSLVITSLLFSAMVLNPSTVQGLVVQAADGAGSEVTAPENPAPTPGQETEDGKTDITYKFLDEKGDPITTLPDKELKDRVKVNESKISKNDVVTFFENSKLSNTYELAGSVEFYTVETSNIVTVKLKNKVQTKTVKIKYTINGKVTDKIPEGTVKNVSEDGTEIDASKLTNPNGYVIVTDKNKSFKIDKSEAEWFISVEVKEAPNPGTSKPTTKPSVTDKKTYKMTVNFIDQATKKKVNSTNISGKNGQIVSFTIPKGYELAKGESKSVKIDKNKSTVEVKVVKNVAGKVTAFKGLISTKNPSVLYSKDGKRIANRGLSANSDWVTDKKLVLNGETYYGVSTNEFVKASDVFEFQAGFSIIGTSRGISKHLYNSKGEMVSNRALAPNTYWRTDKKAMINNQVAYRVSTNEWVLESDLV